VGPVAAPDIRHDLGLSYAGAALVLFTIPQIVAMVLEPPLLLAASRLPRRLASVGGLAVMGCGLLACAAARSAIGLALATSLVWVASGVGVNLVEATLMDAHPARRERMALQWGIAGALGDLSVPLLTAALAAFALSWRVAFACVGAAILLLAGAVGTRPMPAPAAGDHRVATPLWQAARNRELLRWLLGAASCALLDEVFVAFAALYLTQHLGAAPTVRALGLAAFTAGCIAGLVVTERAVARGADPLALLRRASVACAAALAAFIAAPSVGMSAAALGLVGLCAAPLHPLSEARAYAAAPGQAHVVQIVGGLMAPIDVGTPLLLGWLADHVGLEVALMVLLLQPALVWRLARPTHERPA